MNHSFLKFTAFTLLAAAGVALSACTEEAADSTDIKTSGIHAVFAAVAKGDGTTVVTGDLHVASASGTPLELKGSDELLARVAAESKALGGTNTQGKYQASFGTDAADTVVVVDFNRAAEDVSAPGSTVTLPAPFTLSLDGLSSGASIQRGTDVNLKMEPAGASGAKVNWSVSGTCIWDKSVPNVGDDGTIMIPASNVDATPSGEGKTCEVTVTVERVNGGTLATQFKEGGSVTAKQIRSVTFNSTPAANEMMQAGSGGSSGTGGAPSTGGASSTGGAPSTGGANNGGAAGAR